MKSLFLILCSFVVSFTVATATPVVLEDKTQRYSLGPYLAYLEDPSGTLSIEEVSSSEWSAAFTPSTKDVLNFGITDSVYWVRFELQVPPSNSTTWLIDTLRNDWRIAQLYVPTGKNAWIMDEAGRGPQYNKRNYVYYHWVLYLPNSLKADQTLYLRFQSSPEQISIGKSALPMELDLRLWSLEYPQPEVDWKLYFNGAFHGILAIMMIYNLFLFFSIREIVYFYYSAYILALITFIMMLDGVGIHIFWRQSEWVLEHIVDFSVGIFGCFLILFTKAFLQTPHYAPKIDKIFSFVVVFNLGMALFSLFLPYESTLAIEIMSALNILGLPLPILAGVICLKKGFTPAKYYLLASAALFAGGLMLSFQTIKIIPGSTDIGILYVKLGLLTEAVLYSFALAHRFKYERKLKVEAQQQALENLQKADQIKDEFLANTSHELRTPLNGMIGLAEATLHDLESRSIQRIYSNLTLIISSGRRLSLLVNDILDFSKLKHKSIQLNRRPIELYRLVESILILSQSAIRHKPVQLINQVNRDETPLVLADEARLEQILYNLVGNAIKFTHEGSVTIKAERKDMNVIISVVDTGIGIPKAKQTQIFNAFEQIDGSATRQYEGTGLGLTVVQQLVNLHQSQLTVESEVHQGSAFSFSLPIASYVTDAEGLPTKGRPMVSDHAGESISLENNLTLIPSGSPQGNPIEAGEPQIRPAPQAAIPQQTKTLKGFLDILIVDDDPLNLEVICQQLDSPHYTLQTAQNGSEALQLIEQGQSVGRSTKGHPTDGRPTDGRPAGGRPPDLILLDVMMPEISGFEVCQALRRHHHQNQLPIIFITAKNRESDVLRGFEVGGNDYLTKPFFRSELIQRVENQLEIMLYQKQADALKAFANSISHYVSHQAMMQEAFAQILHWSFVDEAALFQGEELLFHSKLGEADSSNDSEFFIRSIPTPAVSKTINLDFQTRPIAVINAIGQNHLLGQFYQPGHFLFLCPQHLPDHLFVFYRNLERKPFDESKAASYVQSMISQIQTTQTNLESLFDDDKLVAVIGQVQPRLSEITHIKSTSPTLELHFDSDKRPEYIDGCSLEKLNLYFKETLLVRIHKSYLVNPSKVVTLHKVSRSRLLKIELTSEEIIPVGRTYMEKARQYFAKQLKS